MSVAAAEHSTAVKTLIRLGFVARAITYGLMGALAMALALGAGTSGTKPNQQGALALLDRAPLGNLALIVVAAGLLAYAAWKLVLGFRGRGPEGAGGTGTSERAGNIGGGLVYLGFFFVALRTLTGGGSSTATPKQAAAGVLGWPAGPWLVGAAGIVLIAISVYQVYDAVSGGFASESKTDQMGPEERRAFMLFGRAGLISRAVVFALVGYFVLRTAIDYSPRSAVGIDGALGRLHHQPLGPWLVGLVAVGLIVFAVYSLFDARYRRL